MKRALLPIVLLLVVVGTASAASSKAAYIKKADRLCKAGNTALAPISNELTDIRPTTASGIAKAVKLMGKAFAIEHTDYGKLVALTKPPAYKAVLNRLWGALATEIADTKKLIDAFNELNSTAITKDENAITLAKASYKGLAQGFGFHYCGTH